MKAKLTSGQADAPRQHTTSNSETVQCFRQSTEADTLYRHKATSSVVDAQSHFCEIQVEKDMAIKQPCVSTLLLID